MVEIQSISFENYKAFSGLESIEIRPLTIIIGRNNSGKSIITRLPLQIARGLSERARGPLELEFDKLNFGGSFVDLIHNRIPHGSVSLGVTCSTKDNKDSVKHTFGFWAKIQHYDEYKLQVITEFTIYRDNSPLFTLLWNGKDPLKDINLYSLKDRQSKFNCRAVFQGLFPIEIVDLANKKSILRDKYTKALVYLLRIRDVFDRITYLGPFREEPRRGYLFPGGLIQNVGVGGAEAPLLLGDDYLRRKSMILGAVANWFSQNLGGWPLGLSSHGDTFSLVLRHPRNTSLEVNLADVGTGISQVLPIVVQHHFKTMMGQPPSIEIIEQPELHLHPGAHGNLADLYVESTKLSGSFAIIETHSENFLLRVRRRIAEGKIDADQVNLYWIDDESISSPRLKKIHIMKSGGVDMWPAGVFSEDFEEVRAIHKAQAEQKQ